MNKREIKKGIVNLYTDYIEKNFEEIIYKVECATGIKYEDAKKEIIKQEFLHFEKTEKDDDVFKIWYVYDRDTGDVVAQFPSQQRAENYSNYINQEETHTDTCARSKLMNIDQLAANWLED